MSEKVGPVFWGSDEEMVFLGRELGVEKRYSESIANLIDSEVSRLMDDAFKTAKTTIEKHRDILNEIAGRLIEKETIEKNEFEELIKSFDLSR